MSAAAVNNPTDARPDPRAAAPSVGQKAASGMAWLLAQTLGYKVLSFFGQIVLTHLILPEHTAQINLALGVAAFTNFLQQPGLREVLVQRRTRNPRWDEVGMWFGISLGVVAGVLTLVAGPVAAWWFQSPPVANLLFVLAIAAPLTGLGTVSEARLQCELRIKALAIIEVVKATGILAGTVALASMGWGAYAFALPVPIMAAAKTLLMWQMARPRFGRRLHARRWKFLLTDSLTLFVASMVTLLITQGSLFVLARRADDHQAGLYAFGYNLSLTSFALLAYNIGNVMFPMLSSMQGDAARLVSTFRRSGRLLNLLGVPACLLQGALAAPFIGIACNARWAGSIPVLQILSIAMSLVITWPSSRSLVQAQGRYTLGLLVIAIDAVVFLTAVGLATYLSPTPSSVALGVVAAFLFTGLFNAWVALRPIGGSWRDVLHTVLTPTAIGWLSVGGAYAAAVFARRHVPIDGRVGPLLLEGAITLTLSAALFFGLLRMLDPASWVELSGFARRIAGRFGLRIPG
ncbi:MAG: oligosaccharide flippase family protein [Phycisphaerales bacterium]